MPLNSAQLAALVERVRHKTPPVVIPSPPPAPSTVRPPRSVRRPAALAPQSPSSAPPAPGSRTPPLTPKLAGAAPTASPPSHSSPAPQPEPAAGAEDFPIGWALTKESWHFHRRFFRVFRRPMALGEYSHLLWQVRRRRAEHLGEDCWRVTLPDGRRTLAVRATRWQLLTILPKNWQPLPPG